MAFAVASTAPAFSAVAETTIEPDCGIVIFNGKIHLLLLVSATTPARISVPEVPVIVTSTVEYVANAREMPLELF